MVYCIPSTRSCHSRSSSCLSLASSIRSMLTCSNRSPTADSASIMTHARFSGNAAAWLSYALTPSDGSFSELLLLMTMREVASVRWYIFQLWLPVFQIIFRIVEDLTCLACVLERCANISRNNGGIIEEVEETTTVTGKDDLLLGALDGSCELGGISFLDLLTSLFQWSA